MNLDKYNVEDATHQLSCAHQINPRNRNEYKMPCIILKELPNNKVKIIVFGDRRVRLDFQDTATKKRIRYVDRTRVAKSRKNE